MINEGVKLIYHKPYPAHIRERILQLLESGRMTPPETPGTYAQLAEENRSAALACRRESDERIGHYARLYLKYRRLERAALRRLFE